MGKEEGLCADRKSGDTFQKSPGALLTFWKGPESMNKDGGLGRLCSLESKICSQCALPWRWPKGSRDPGLGEPSDGGSPSLGTCGGSDGLT